MRYKKIAIVGCAGSGKTTLAFELQKRVHLPLYHLDQYYWLPNWERVGLEKFTEMHTTLCEKDTWIIEGSYIKLLRSRVLHADMVIFLDIPRYLCIWYVLKRAFLNVGKELPGSPAYCKQRIFSVKFFEFLRWIWNFNKRYRHTILDVLQQFKSKRIYILRSPKEINDCIKKF